MSAPRTPAPAIRLTGLDLARGLAVVGMVLVNYMYVFSHDLISAIGKEPSSFNALSVFAQAVAGLVLVGFAGRAAAVFLVLLAWDCRFRFAGGAGGPIRFFVTCC